MRQTLFQESVHTLYDNGFSLETFFDSNGSFDIIARKEGLILLIKVLHNIDALRPEHAEDLKKLARAFTAHPVIIGERSKIFQLQKEILYERYALPVLSIDGFKLLLDTHLPVARAFKGQHVVELDGNRLRAEREARAFTLKTLSEKAAISLESLHRYEKGHPADLDTAKRLESILSTSLIRGINVFEETDYTSSPPEEETPENEALAQLRELGLKLSVFKRAPLTAAGIEEHHLLISHAETKPAAKKKAFLLTKTQRIVDHPGFLLSPLSQDEVEDVPVVNVDELSTFSGARDILHTINERHHDLRRKKNE
ncbi:MAG: hypothetical protein Q8P05_00915 [Candidatus Diapherotrites archaeon]|nr:hypothetical protein [Candidatus Diapherotrites archaeon]MDZ4256697.1 hypothetical protein [archaeon]